MASHVLVLGLGSIGLRHARNLRRLGAEVLGFDPSHISRAKASAEGIAIASAREEALRTSRAVIIATPSQYHYADLSESVNAGKPVFVEKPLAHTLKGLREIMTSATAPVFPALILRHDSAVQAARAFISALGPQTDIGGLVSCESYLPNWRPDADYKAGYAADPVSGGVIFDHIHEIDLGWHLLGPMQFRAASAMVGTKLGLKSDERAEMDFDHARGQLRIVVDYASPGRNRRETALQGAWGRLKLDIVRRRLTIWDSADVLVRDDVMPGAFEEDYLDQMKLFLDVAAGKAKPICSVTEALDVLALALAARKACHLPTA